MKQTLLFSFTALISYRQIINQIGGILLYSFIFKNNQNNLPPFLQAEGPRFEPVCSHLVISHLWRFATYVAFFIYPTNYPTNFKFLVSIRHCLSGKLNNWAVKILSSLTLKKWLEYWNIGCSKGIVSLWWLLTK